MNPKLTFCGCYSTDVFLLQSPALGQAQLQESLDDAVLSDKDLDPAFPTMAVAHLLLATVSVFITLTFLTL